MNIEQLKRKFNHLSQANKILLISCVMAMLFAFTPWFEINKGIGITEDITRLNGFSRYWIFGVVSFGFALVSLLVLIRELVTGREKMLGFYNYIIWMFLSGESVFALTLSVFVFSDLFNDFSDANFRFGIFLSIVCHVMIFAGAYFSMIKEKKVSAKKSFQSLSDEDLARLNLQPEDPDQLSFGD
ncbi:MAG: hypothetical protein N4A36_00095 [Candidatus Gracilibacteria bacterium]|jgi:hypothetical protein|nr:hypothetical protein [Candidatus Gracilibacteria bacterium]